MVLANSHSLFFLMSELNLVACGVAFLVMGEGRSPFVHFLRIYLFLPENFRAALFSVTFCSIHDGCVYLVAGPAMHIFSDYLFRRRSPGENHIYIIVAKTGNYRTPVK